MGQEALEIFGLNITVILVNNSGITTSLKKIEKILLLYRKFTSLKQLHFGWERRIRSNTDFWYGTTTGNACGKLDNLIQLWSICQYSMHLHCFGYLWTHADGKHLSGIADTLTLYKFAIIC